MKKSFLFISCEEAKHLCDKSQYDEASAWEIIKLKIRLSYCRITQSYSSRNYKLSEALDKVDINCLKTEERNKLEEQFKAELAKEQQN
ncbi:MAG: hypothetical protein AB8B52_06865 [Winogradskyella sp.]|uniref:hypothetical protein n=1 Tax=Winogradskyella sp. TaxID=1883156 RepID=UPI00385D1BF8